MCEKVQHNLVHLMYSITTNIKISRASLVYYIDHRAIQSAYRLLLISAVSSQGSARIYLQKYQCKLSGKHIFIDDVTALKQFIEA